MTLVYRVSKTSEEIGWFTVPQSILSFEIASSTINLSFGERPVYLPVFALIAPVEVKISFVLLMLLFPLIVVLIIGCHVCLLRIL